MVLSLTSVQYLMNEGYNVDVLVPVPLWSSSCYWLAGYPLCPCSSLTTQLRPSHTSSARTRDRDSEWALQTQQQLMAGVGATCTSWTLGCGSLDVGSRLAGLTVDYTKGRKETAALTARARLERQKSGAETRLRRRNDWFWLKRSVILPNVCTHM
jgi:hypothetical protein